MNEIELQEKLEKLNILENNFQQNLVIQDNLTEEVIVEWISQTVVLFSEVGLDQTLINSFLNYFSFKSESVEIPEDIVIPSLGPKPLQKISISKIGPFRENLVDRGRLGIYPSFGSYSASGSVPYVKVFFTSARAVLKRHRNEKNIVPIHLIESLEKGGKGNIALGLKNINDYIYNGDPKGAMHELFTVLDLFLKEIKKLKEYPDVKNKLDTLRKNKSLCDELGVSHEIVLAIENSRLIRNQELVHKKTELKYNIPLMVSISCVHLVILFIESILSAEIESER